jgi:hypothetical protein
MIRVNTVHHSVNQHTHSSVLYIHTVCTSIMYILQVRVQDSPHNQRNEISHNPKFYEAAHYSFGSGFDSVTKKLCDVSDIHILCLIPVYRNIQKLIHNYDSATWYSTHTCSTLLRFNCENGVFE